MKRRGFLAALAGLVGFGWLRPSRKMIEPSLSACGWTETPGNWEIVPDGSWEQSHIRVALGKTCEPIKSDGGTVEIYSLRIGDWRRTGRYVTAKCRIPVGSGKWVTLGRLGDGYWVNGAEA